jgi:hypothetical protein
MAARNRGATAAPDSGFVISSNGVRHMKKLKHLIIFVVVAWLASGCASLPSAPSYVPSPFSGMHGQ